MIQAGTIWLENGGMENAVCDLDNGMLEFKTYDGLRVLTLTEKELVNILKEYPAWLATIIMNAEE
jgi:hypothetical protein